MRLGLPAIVAAALLIVTVAGAFMGEGWPRYRIAAEERPSQGYLDAESGGVLHGRVNLDGTACLWLGEARVVFGLGGARVDAVAVFWPYGYSAGGWPITVYDAAGKRVATDGNRVSVGGGMLPGSVRSITGCSGFAAYWGASPQISVRSIEQG
jgi:hypothetical protein